MTPNQRKSSPRRILLVEDHPIVREGIKQIIRMSGEFEVCGECDDRSSMFAALNSQAPDAAVVDVSLHGVSGLDLIKDVRAQGHRLPILVLSVHDERLYAERALKAGAQGYLMKDEQPERLIEALRSILSGAVYVSADIASQMLGRMVNHRRGDTPNGVDSLSDRELDIFQRIGRGCSSARIAADLHISVKTVETHRAHIRAKLNLRNGHELMQYAIRWAERSSPVTESNQ